jgi:GLPGLI family protein
MKKLKIILICITVTYMVNCFGQSVSGKVIYKIQLVGYGGDSKDPQYKELNESIIEIANKQTATLTFNNTQSSCVLGKYLVSDSDNNNVRIMAEKMAFVEINGANYFLDKSKNSVVLQNMEGNLIEKKHEKLDWEITTENKIIDGYLCYKAIYLMKFMNRRGIDTSIPIVAWFAPSLPYAYGPKYFNGLPGLILELSDRKTTFLASSITISKDKELVIDFPKGKTISQDDYSKKVMSN